MIKIEVRKVISELREKIGMIQEEGTDEDVFKIIENYILDKPEVEFLNFREKIKLINNIFYTIRKETGILEPYIEDPDINEIMVNGKDAIFIEKKGEVIKIDEEFISSEELEELIRRLVGKVHREINDLNPIVDARLENGSRVNAVHQNIALNGPILTIRKFPQKSLDMKFLIDKGTITEEAADFLKNMVVGGQNIFLSGGTSSGKTSMLNVLAEYIPKKERVIVIEDSAELQLFDIVNIVRLECKNSNAQGKGKVDMQQLIKSSLRMRPDRIIVGEVRGKEVLDMLQALNTGHDGSLSTGHGNSIKGMLRRLETMVLQSMDFPIEAVRGQISQGIDIMIHLGRLADGRRKVFEIAEIGELRGNEYEINPIFKLNEKNILEKTGNRLKYVEKLKLKGLHYNV